MAVIERCFRQVWIRCLLLSLITTCVASATAWSQSIPATAWSSPRTATLGSTARRLPNPVRTASHQEPIDRSILEQRAEHSSGHSLGVGSEPNSIAESSWGMGHGIGGNQHPWNGLRGDPSHAHQILRAPMSQVPSGHSAKVKPHAKKLIHPPYSPHRRRMQPEPATLPGANQQEIWKTPYSYGYFGASGTRHWSLHYGYRDRYTEWRLK